MLNTICCELEALEDQTESVETDPLANAVIIIKTQYIYYTCIYISGKVT